MIASMKIQAAIDRKLSASFCLAAVLGLWTLLIFTAGTGMCASSDSRLDFTLPVPEKTHQQQYLGLEPGTDFSLGQIRAQVVIIEIFSMYCPICQREAARVNQVFDLIQARENLRDTVKLIGIGAGNSDFEVAFFKEKYAIEFPLFSDGDFVIHKKIGEVRTPHFFGLKLDQTGGFSVFYSRSGDISDPETFLETLLSPVGMDVTP